ncbi:MAG: hypothetical protein FI709_12500 [SAR202 cluster bacterium]|nr:plastocyanin/azurin family copper-binding protein [SAR202 cluster bacterium]MDP6663422.1 plastocyanin/azurin family copper-binding protein [SAR202 cluster bacterium]MDP6800099.1 plastocyanin/azurin family copper-binding protein [SAR202 cluster bacterium]MQG58724.1 hypothetical protein [SAR202 cluster bacterium]
MRSVTFVLMLGVVLVALAACGGGDSADPTATPLAPASPPAPGSAAATAPAPAAAPAAAPTDGTAVTVGMNDAGGRGPFVFEPADFTFSAGETVNFKLVGEATFHTFTVDDLGIDVETNANETVDFSFTFDTPGTYELICIPHQALGMVGTITIN